ncbi:MAG: MerR family transcriptional regulator [Pseudobdellovibrionaceae bacterium]
MTTMIDPTEQIEQAEQMNQPDQPDHTEQLELGDIEIILADQHVPEKAPELPPAEQNLTLPAALCDERLLEEINTIPEKMGFKIGEVADMLGIKQYVLRYWESEFEILKPKKASNNQRYYTKKDVENAYLIRKLLHRDRFSIEGARAALKDLKNFVRSEVKKDKAISTMTQKLDSLHDQVDDLMIQIRRTRQLFV